MSEKQNATKVEEKKMTLEDLGLEDESTPAEKSDALAKKGESSFIQRQDGVKIETKSFINPEDAVEKPHMSVPRPETIKRTSVELETQKLKGDSRPSVTVNGNQPAKDEYQDGHVIPKHALGSFNEQQAREAREQAKQLEGTNADTINMQGLTRGDDITKEQELSIVTDVNQIAKNPTTASKPYVSPIQRNLNHLHDLADKGIQRTENEMSSIGGRIEEGKEKYIEYRYKSLMDRAKTSKNLKKKIDYYKKMMDTEPAFDGASDYEKKGYILFKVAKDETIGITDKSFGLAPESIKGYRRNSADNSKHIQSTVDGASETESFDGDQVVIGSAERNDDIPVRKSKNVTPIEEENEHSTGGIGTVIEKVDSAFDEIDKELDDVGVESDYTPEMDIPVRNKSGIGAPAGTADLSNNMQISTESTILQGGSEMDSNFTENEKDKKAATIDKAEVKQREEIVPDTEDDTFGTNAPRERNVVHEAEVVSSELERGLVKMDDPIDPDLTVLDDINNEKSEAESEYMRLYGLTEDQYRKMELDYLKQAADVFKITSEDNDLSSIAEAGAVNLNTALKIFKQQDTTSLRTMKATWPLMFTGIPAETTAFSGQELTQLIDDLQAGFVPTRDNPNPEPSMAQLRSVFTSLYRHFVNPGRPSFNDWLHRISSIDFYDLIFAQYNAQFYHNNYLAYQCPKHGCSKLFLEKKPVMDMVVFPNDKVKERFNAIMHKDSVITNLYRTEPVRINDHFAMSFRTPSVYSMTFEPASLNPADKSKYSSIVGFLPMLDAVWIIDDRNRKKHRIDFGIVKDDLEKTVLRKIKGILQIMSTFNVDQRSIIYGEYLKIVTSMQKESITYQIPETKCPVCGTVIPAETTDPIGALFTRARLSIEAASTPALL